jgi:fibronectin-binding autotransporter adhesin
MNATITSPKPLGPALSLLIAVLCAALLAPSVQAATYTWAGGTNDWDTAAAWTPNIAGGPAAGDSVTFTNTGASRLNVNSTTTPSISLVDWNFSQATGDANVLNNTSTGTNTAMSFELTGTLTQGSTNNLNIRGHTGGTMAVSLNHIEMTNGRLGFGGDYSQDTRYGLTAFSVSGTANLSGTSAGTSFAVGTAPGVTASFQQVNLGGNIIFRLSTVGGSNVVRDVTMTGLNGTANTLIDANSAATTGNSFTTLTINSTAGTTSTFDGQLRNGAAGNYLNLVKSGTGTQVLGGSNSYTGTTTVSAGTLVVLSTNALGATNGGTVVNSGATLDMRAFISAGEALSVGGNGVGGNGALITSTGSGGTGPVTLTSDARIGGDGSLALGAISGTGFGITKVGEGLTRFFSFNTYTGTTFVEAGTLQIQDNERISDVSDLRITGGTFNLQSFNEMVNRVFLTSGSIIGTGTLTARLDGFDLQGGTVEAILGGDKAITVSSGTTTLGSAGRLGTGKALTINSGQLTLGGDETVASYIQAGGTLAGTGSTLTSTAAYDMRAGTVSANLGGSAALNKTTAGTLTLSGSNSYTGTTTVSAGSLIINGNQSDASGVLTVSSGATLGGSGTIGGAAIINGILAPGNSIGTLTTLGDVTWNASVGNSWVFELGAAGLTLAAPGDSDFLSVGGDFLRGNDGSAWTFDFAGTGDLGWYKLVEWSGTSDFVPSNFSGVNLGGGFDSNFAIQDDALYVNVVPEPSTYALLALAAAGLGAHVVRRRKRS